MERRLLVGEHVVDELRGVPHLPLERREPVLGQHREWRSTTAAVPAPTPCGMPARTSCTSPSHRILERGILRIARAAVPLQLRRRVRSSSPWTAALPPRSATTRPRRSRSRRTGPGQLWATWKPRSTSFVVNASVRDPSCNDLPGAFRSRRKSPPGRRRTSTARVLLAAVIAFGREGRRLLERPERTTRTTRRPQPTTSPDDELERTRPR